MKINKYDIVYVKDGEFTSGSVQHLGRPAVILQNNKGNAFSTTTIVAFITSKVKRTDIPTHVLLDGYNLWKPSMLMLEQITTVPKSFITKKIDTLSVADQIRVDTAMLVSLGYLPTERGYAYA